MPNYYLWNQGCQMNRADSAQVAGYLEAWGWQGVAEPAGAQLVVVNTCVVRQSAEDRARSFLRALGAWKKTSPGSRIALTGCLVQPQVQELHQQFPQVDLVFPPQDWRGFLGQARHLGLADGKGTGPNGFWAPSAFLSVIQGCDSYCTYCIVPYRRGRERSRPVGELVAQSWEMARGGTKELVLLGQNVQAYGRDLPGQPDLADLLAALSQVPGLVRLRFLTSHPRDFTPKFLQKLARLKKVCPSFSLPVQAGDDRVLQTMGRGYSVEEYRSLVASIRQTIPEAAISTDVIVGFPGESETQFEGTEALLRELRLEPVHIAAYSPRPGTWASHHLKDGVPSQEKERRKKRLESLQKAIALDKAQAMVGQGLEVLVEREGQGRWQGRTPQGKLVFFEDKSDLAGELVRVKINLATPWWLGGHREGGC